MENRNWLILIAGLPGTGKTTVAHALSVRCHFQHFNSDALRREMGLMGHYTAEDKARVYAALLERTRQRLLEGHTVVVDSTFYLKSIRESFLALAAACGVSVLWVETQADEATLRERLSRPRPDSDADYSVYSKMRLQFEPLPEDRIIIRTDEMTPEAAAAFIAGHLSS